MEAQEKDLVEYAWKRVVESIHFYTSLIPDNEFDLLEFDEYADPYGDYFDEQRSNLSEILRQAIKVRDEGL